MLDEFGFSRLLRFDFVLALDDVDDFISEIFEPDCEPADCLEGGDFGPFRTARIRYVAQRAERCCFFGKSADVYQPPEFFQADDEGSIPFTRSNLFNDLRRPPREAGRGSEAP
jgi:hypothetical protein